MDVPIDPDLTQRLLRVAQDSGADQTSFGSARRPTPDALMPLTGERPDFPALTGQVSPRRTYRRVLIGAAVGVSVCVGLLIGLGNPAVIVPEADTVAALSILAGERVAGTEDVTSVQVDLRGGEGTAVVREYQGKLDPDAIKTMSADTIDGHTVHVMSQTPWHAVWQSDETVIEVVSAHESDALADLLTLYPDRSFSDSLDRRIVRGWRVLSGVWTSR